MGPYKQPNYSHLTPCVIVDDVQKSIDFYTKAFNFEVLEKHEREGIISGATLKLGEVTFMLFCKSLSSYAKTMPSGAAGMGSSIYVYCPNVDELYKNALAYGATSIAEPQNSFWGDRYCQLRDPDGYEWGLATYQQAS